MARIRFKDADEDNSDAEEVDWGGPKEKKARETSSPTRPSGPAVQTNEFLHHNNDWSAAQTWDGDPTADEVIANVQNLPSANWGKVSNRQ